MQEGKREWADQHVIGVAKDVDPEVVQGLRDNFNGECSEVGMYLAMSRQADREGFPEVAEAYKRIAFERKQNMLLSLQSCWARSLWLIPRRTYKCA